MKSLLYFGFVNWLKGKIMKSFELVKDKQLTLERWQK